MPRGLATGIIALDRMTTFQPNRAGDAMVGVEEAQERVLADVTSIGAEQVPLEEAAGRVLRESVRSPHDVPESDNSAMDGYAVRAEDVARATHENPALLRVIGDVPAGALVTSPVVGGSAMRIMTGALVPTGADAVVQVEATDAGGESVRVFEPVPAGANIRRRGEDMREGSLILDSGALIGAGEIAVLAGAQKVQIECSRRPTLAILSTGDELVDVHATRTAAKVVNSNAYALAALAVAAGAVPRIAPIVPDRAAETVSAIEAALDCDFVVSSGGVSVGAFDFVKDALDALGAQTRFWRVAMKPGKPVIFSRVRDRLYFGLPGNPASCMVAFILFVAPAIRKALGLLDGVLPPVVTCTLAGPLRSKGDRRTYFRVRVSAEDGDLFAQPLRAQGSGMTSSMAGANGLAYLDRGVSGAAVGDRIPTVLFGQLL